jgi:hypothetical protein
MGNLQAGKLRSTVAISAPSQRTAEPKGKMRWNGRKHFLRLGAERYHRTQRPYYRRQAVRARRAAEGATTQAVKARLLDDAGQYDELAAKVDAAGAEAEKPS